MTSIGAANLKSHDDNRLGQGSNGVTIRPRVAMVQDGARLHYAIPLALQRAGILERVFTSYYVTPGSPADLAGRVIAKFNRPLGQRMLQRRCDELDHRKVVQNPWLGFREYLSRPGVTHSIEHMQRTSGWYGRWIRRKGLGQANALMGFLRNVDPGLLEHCRGRGMAVVGEQTTAPVAAEIHEITLQHQRWPGWEPKMSLDDIQRFEPLQARNWKAVHHITCASEYVRDGIVAQGVRPERISVIPYPFNGSKSAVFDRTHRSGPLTVGMVGSASLRKGAPYFFEVARRFRPSEARFVLIGKIALEPSMVERHRGHVELIGAVSRREVERWLGQFDVFFFPATCEGSAGSVIEAMASCLPVVTCPNSGTYARDGIEAFIRPYDDIAGCEECIRRLLEDGQLRSQMGLEARRRVETYDIDFYSRSISHLFSTLVNMPALKDAEPCG